MADAVVSAALQQLAMIVDKEVEQEIRLLICVKKEVQKLTTTLQTIQAVLMDAEKRQVKEEAVRVWLDELKDVSYDMEDLLDEWNTKILKLQIEGIDENNASITVKKVCFFYLSLCFRFRKVVLFCKIGPKVKEINEKLEAIAKEKDMYNFDMVRSIEQPHQQVKSTSFVDVTEIYGRSEEKNVIINKLLCGGDEQNGLHIISIVGMGGIGKTTLAQLVYNDNEVINNFDKRIWVCVSDPFDEFRISKAIIEGIEDSASDLVELESLLLHISKSIVGKKILLVLDDLWTEDYNKWESLYHCLKSSLCGSKILVTTRKQTVSRALGSTDIITMKELFKDECWLLFSKFAFSDRSSEECKKLEEVGKEIVGKCKGLPLVIKIISSLLRFKKHKEEWQRILNHEIWELEVFEKGIFPPLLLSYNELPSMVRQCYLYCAIFPKDYIINKDQLIKLWMSQGYLSFEQNKEVEIVGQEYFDLLVTRSFFYNLEKDDNGDIIRCKMHDILHDFAQFLSRNRCLTLEVNSLKEPSTNSSYERAQHAMLKLGKAKSFPVSICSYKKLRSLLIQYEATDQSSITILPNLFNQLTCLRALDISGERWGMNLVKEIPKEIGKLIHLRYLNLSQNKKIKELPEILCGLYNLQILDITSCWSLRKLPQGIGRLINLRHFMNDGTLLCCIPKGMERLTCLRTLSQFVASGRNHGSKACSLECLKNLNHLRGSLCIKGLGNVANVVQAKRAELKNKKNIGCLGLSFERDEEEERMIESDEALLEALQPPKELAKLEIALYKGNAISPSWLFSLAKLRVLTLGDCMNCEHLPPLGNLSSLESLIIKKMRSVKRVGKEFLGTSSSSSVIAFPRLKFLELWYMEEWEIWDYGITKDTTIMPCLRSLLIGFCPKLKSLPINFFQTKTLEKLKIIFCPVLGERYKKGSGEDWPHISYIPNICINH